MPAGDVLQRKVDKLFQGIPNGFGITYDIPIAGFGNMGRDHDPTLYKVLRICRQAKLKLNKDKCLFWHTSIPFFRDVISHNGLSPDLRKGHALTRMPPWKCKRAGVIPVYSQLPKYTFTNDSEVCERLGKLILVKTRWPWNGMYQELYDKSKNIINQNACMKFYDASNHCVW